MKEYEMPKVNVVRLEDSDIICASLCSGYNPGEDTTEDDT